MNQINHLENLIRLLSRLPSLGPRSARRLALHLLGNRNNIMSPLIESMNLAIKNVKICQICGNLDSANICSICLDQSRNSELLCVVEDIADLWAIERNKNINIGHSRIFEGKYHILGGTLCAISGKGPEDLNIKQLVLRIKNDEIKEVILAINPTIEGQTTAYYLAEILKEFNIKISKLAYGIPIGSELDYLDEGTLGIAFKTRNDFNY